MEGQMIGVDLCDSYTQLCVAGREGCITLPTVICLDKMEKKWLVGEEAYARALTGDGVIVDKLVKLMLKNGTATIAGTKYSGKELLTEFLKSALEKLPKEEGEPAEILNLTVTIPKIETHLVDRFLEVLAGLSVPMERIHVISHTEAFLYYVIGQKREIWNNQVGMFDLSEDCLCYYEMKVQRGMRKATVIAEREKLEEGFSLDILESPAGIKMADKILCSCGERLMEKKLYSSVFLTGKGFERQDWAGDFMKMLCQRRRVYGEQALFAWGAANQAADSREKKSAYPYIFLCDGRLSSTVSIRILHRDQESQLVLAEAGDRWYGMDVKADFILDHQDDLEFMIESQISKEKRTFKMPLEGFPKREDKTLKVRVHIGFLDENTMALEVKDLGFGEFYPSTGASIRQEVRL